EGTGAVGVALLPRHRGDPGEQRRSLAALAEEGGLGEGGDVVGHLEVAERAAALHVVHAIGNALADEVREFLDQIGVLQKIRSGRAGREGVLVTADWGTRVCGRVRRLISHVLAFSSPGSSPGDSSSLEARPRVRHRARRSFTDSVYVF